MSSNLFFCKLFDYTSMLFGSSKISSKEIITYYSFIALERPEYFSKKQNVEILGLLK